MLIRPSSKQIEALGDFLLQNPGIAKGVIRTSHWQRRTKAKWNAVAPHINSLGPAKKDGKAWTKYWADKKCALKKIINRMSVIESSEEICLSPMELKLVELIKEQPPRPEPNNQGTSSVNYEETVRDESDPALKFESSPDESADSEPEVSYPAAAPRQDPLRRSPRHRLRPGPPRTTIDRLIAIEQKRVQAELVTARAFTQAVQQMSAIHTSLDGLAAATRHGAQTVTDALLAIADALSR